MMTGLVLLTGALLLWTREPGAAAADAPSVATPLRSNLPPASAAPARADPQPDPARSWRLSEDDQLAELAKSQPSPGGHEALSARIASEAARKPKRPPKLDAVLAPLLDVEYPSEAMFRQALSASQCARYVTAVREEAQANKQTLPDTTCPPLKTGAPAQGKNPAQQLHAELLQPAGAERIVEAALRQHPFKQARPLALKGASGCGCARQDTHADEVHGFLAWWHAEGQQQEVDFSPYNRLSYLGASLGKNGAVTLLTETSQALDFAREAQRHNTAVDLVLHRRDWSFLRTQGERERSDFIEIATRDALQAAHTPLTDAAAQWQRLLLPFWREDPRAFAGLTLFFEEPPLLNEGDAKAFEEFMQAMVKRLMERMSQTRAVYHLNIVMPDHAVGRPGIFSAAQLLAWQLMAEASLGDRQAVDQRRRAMASGEPRQGLPQPDIRLRFVLLLNEPTQDSKKEVRARLDGTEGIAGQDRVALLQGMVPLLVNKGFGLPQGLPPQRTDQLNADLAYMRRNFGGVALWPMPMPGRGQGTAVLALLNDNYGSVLTPTPRKGTGDAVAGAITWGTMAKVQLAAARHAVCSEVCPQRLPLRLLLQGLLLALLVASAAWVLSREVRRYGHPYLRALLLGGVLATMLGLALLSCDPMLASWRLNNLIVYLPLALLAALGARAVFKPRRREA